MTFLQFPVDTGVVLYAVLVLRLISIPVPLIQLQCVPMGPLLHKQKEA